MFHKIHCKSVGAGRYSGYPVPIRRSGLTSLAHKSLWLLIPPQVGTGILNRVRVSRAESSKSGLFTSVSEPEYPSTTPLPHSSE